MQYFENIHGSKEIAIPLIKQVDTVYVKTNIHEETTTDKITGEIRKEWVWNEAQYTYVEYAQKQISDVESAIAELTYGGMK
ncbi:MAG: hypothetical protein RRY40_06210 [Oscillospiraceae bacterium]